MQGIYSRRAFTDQYWIKWTWHKTRNLRANCSSQSKKNNAKQKQNGLKHIQFRFQYCARVSNQSFQAFILLISLSSSFSSSSLAYKTTTSLNPWTPAANKMAVIFAFITESILPILFKLQRLSPSPSQKNVILPIRHVSYVRCIYSYILVYINAKGSAF